MTEQLATHRPAARLVGTLTVAGALAGLLLVLVNSWAEPRIIAHRAEVLREAIQEVLGAPERYETLFLVDGAFTSDLPATVDSMGLDRVYIGYDASGRSVGYAIAGGEPGFQDVIRLLFAFDPVNGRIRGMKVLESKETPGLGDKIEKDTAFVAGCSDPAPPLVGVKPGSRSDDDHEVDMITGATISSRAVIRIINHRVEELDPYLRAYEVAAAGKGAP
ncbi:MAG: RnfABCDGE type electron transport complex subunit G [Gemmatimonadales bacterium]|nr:MAG: RnfABCDGE type electron transport complex subunit G [Gemmatimonadales bacterium]